jgi:uncharacterized protein
MGGFYRGAEGKSEIRISKSETNSKHQVQNPNSETRNPNQIRSPNIANVAQSLHHIAMSSTQVPSRVREDVAYMLPMGVFLVLTMVGGEWPGLFAASYIVKTLVVAGLLVFLWPQFTKINWKYGWLGIIVGIVGVVQWVGMEKLLLHYWGDYHFMKNSAPVDPFRDYSPAFAWAFIFIRIMCATLVVPVMEELFWRDFLWRSMIAPNDFKMAEIGEWDWKAFLLVAVAFGAGVHFEWLTAITWGLMIGGLLVYTRSLGACIIAHGVTNLLLGLYVVIYQDWRFW